MPRLKTDNGLARGDVATATEDRAITIDVLANDKGGAAAHLFSVDQDNPAIAALQGVSALGATISIVGGKIAYLANGAALDALSAGELVTDTFTYTMQVGNGALSQATVTVTVTGVNDAPIVKGAVLGAATEGGATVSLDALASASDVDHGTTLMVVNAPANLSAGVTYDAITHRFTLDPTNAAYNHLAAGATQTVTVRYDVSDGMVATPGGAVSWTVTGVNDPAVISGSKAGDVTEDAPTKHTASGVLTVTDPDEGQASFRAPASLAGQYGAFA
ncbi:MAG: hypothetical protein JWQ46_429, partial [Phenylobacterium sp.]|nr:hypothetical protein [Phenylobacterium sp.]